MQDLGELEYLLLDEDELARRLEALTVQYSKGIESDKMPYKERKQVSAKSSSSSFSLPSPLGEMELRVGAWGEPPEDSFPRSAGSSPSWSRFTRGWGWDNRNQLFSNGENILRSNVLEAYWNLSRGEITSWKKVPERVGTSAPAWIGYDCNGREKSRVDDEILDEILADLAERTYTKSRESRGEEVLRER